MYLIIKLVSQHPLTNTISQHPTRQEALEKCAELDEKDGWRDHYKIVYVPEEQ